MIDLETPSHNGPWRGTLPVRYLEPGVTGDDLPAGRARIARKRSEHLGRVRAAKARWGDRVNIKLEQIECELSDPR